jgi:TPR repeat protein
MKIRENSPTWTSERSQFVALVSAVVMAASSVAGAEQARAGPSVAYDNAMAAYQRGDYSNAYREFFTAAKQGDDDALVSLWQMADGGCGSPPEEVSTLLKTNFGRGNATSRFLWAYAAYEGGAATKEQTMALSASPPLVEASAREGFPFAMFMTGNFYMGPTSLLVRAPRDPLQAFAWYSLAIRRGWSTKFLDDLDVEGLARKIGLSPEQITRGKELTDQLDKEVPKSRLIPWDGMPSLCQHK